MRTYHTEKEMMKDVRDNTLTVNDSVKFKFNMTRRINLDVWNIYAGDITAWDIFARNIDAWDIIAHDIFAKDISAVDIDVETIKARKIKYKNLKVYEK